MKIEYATLLSTKLPKLILCPWELTKNPWAKINIDFSRLFQEKKIWIVVISLVKRAMRPIEAILKCCHYNLRIVTARTHISAN